MSLTIEDGTLVTSADSYITETEYQTWADARFGASRSTAPADDAAAEVLILRAMDYFEGLDFIGMKRTEDQDLQWPRTEVYIDRYAVDTNEIPTQVKRALYELTYVEELGDSELAQIDRKTVKEKIDVLEVEYAATSSSKKFSPAVHRALRKLVRAASSVARG